MSCLTVEALRLKLNRASIVRGEELVLKAQVIALDNCPKEFTTPTGVTGYLGGVNIVGTIDSAETGKFSLPLSASGTLAMAAGEGQGVQLTVQHAAGVTIVQNTEGISIFDPLGTES